MRQIGLLDELSGQDALSGSSTLRNDSISSINVSGQDALSGSSTLEELRKLL